MDFTKVIRTIPDYPKPGIMFRDITTLLGNARSMVLVSTGRRLFAGSSQTTNP